MEKFDLTTKPGKLRRLPKCHSFPSILYLDWQHLLQTNWYHLKTRVKLPKNLSDGVKEMEITLNNDKGFDFGVPVEGIDIKAKAGSNEKIHIKVVYK